MTFNEKITVRLPKELKRELTKQAKARMLQPADVAREALAEYLKPRATAIKQLTSEAARIHWKLMAVLAVGSGVVAFTLALVTP